MKLRHLLITGIVATVASSGFSLADHLLFSEVLVSAPTQAGPLSSEYAEIFNPTNTTVTLTNYYLSDYNASAGNRYWNLPSFVGGRDYGCLLYTSDAADE